MTRKCPLCRERNTVGRGEHVYPQWYLRHLGLGPGPMPWTSRGKPILDRNGKPVRANHRVPVLLPMCEPCNTELEHRFETPTKDLLRRIFDRRGDDLLTADEARLVGLWFAKTLLLLAHSESSHQHPKIAEVEPRWTPDEMPPHEYFEWLVNGNDPPDGLSVWIFRADENLEGSRLHLVPLPDVESDGSSFEFVSHQIAFHGICVTLVLHPGWRIDHPLEVEGHAARLLPATGEFVDMRSLPVLWPQAVQWLGCGVVLKPGVLGSDDLPPLRSSTAPFGVVFEALPFAEHWYG